MHGMPSMQNVRVPSCTLHLQFYLSMTDPRKDTTHTIHANITSAIVSSSTKWADLLGDRSRDGAAVPDAVNIRDTSLGADRDHNITI